MINCEKYENEIKEELKLKIKEENLSPTLAIVQVGNNKASNNYVRSKLNACDEVGIRALMYKFKENITQADLIEFIQGLNIDKTIDGIIIQLPLPIHLDEYTVTQSINKYKDVDGFKLDSPYIPCTPKGVLTILDKLNIDLVGKNVTLVGYGKLVNKPLMNLLSNKGTTVTVCRSKTPIKQLRKYCKMSDIIVTAVGRNNTINYTCINMLNKPIIIDCGIDIKEEKNKDGKTIYRQYGDCNINLYDEIDMITPRLKGMGIMTVVSLLENVVKACEING